MKNSKSPKNRDEVTRFIGSIKYLRRFIPGCARVIAPLTDLTSQKVEWKWGKEQEVAFQKAKELLTTPPVLSLPWKSPNIPFVVTTDASAIGTGAILEQNGKVIAYDSHKFDKAERLKSVYEQELLGIRYALQVWRHYLHGRHFTLRTDHRTLRFFLTQPKLTPRQARALDEIQSFDFDIVHISGTKNPADVLSRTPIIIGTMSPIANQNPDEFRNSLKEDDYFGKIISDVENYVDYTLKGDLLYLHEDIICVPAKLRRNILDEIHDKYAHPGIQRQYLLVRSKYYWPKLYDDCRKFINECDVCRRHKDKNRTIGKLQPLPIAKNAWKDIAIDFVSGLPVSDGYNAVATVIDRHSKGIHLIPTRTSLNSEEFADLFMKNIFRLHGMPSSIVSDRDKLFTSTLWQILHRRLGIKHNLTTAYNPHADGVTERANRTVETYLRICVEKLRLRKSEWTKALPIIEFTYNATPHTSTKFAPFELIYGDVPSFGDELKASSAEEYSTPVSSEDVSKYLEQRKFIRLLAVDTLLKTANIMKTQYDLKKVDANLKEGEMCSIKLTLTTRVASATEKVPSHSPPWSIPRCQVIPRFLALIGPFKHYLLPSHWLV